MKVNVFLGGLAVLVGAAGGSAQIIHVNGSCGSNAWTGESAECQPLTGPKRTIQAAIDAAPNGATVLVAPGTYIERINFQGKAITLRSTGGPSQTIINGGGSGSVVTFFSGEGPQSVLDGFTVTGGVASGSGGGIRVLSASPTIANCEIIGNAAPIASSSGGGMAVLFGAPTIRSCIFASNQAGPQGFGGGLYIQDSAAIMMDCVIVGNTAGDGGTTGNGGGGGGVAVGGDAQLIRCSIIENGATLRPVNGGGVLVMDGAPSLVNCVIRDNRAIQSPGLGTYTAAATPRLTHCTIAFNAGKIGAGGVDGHSTLTGCIVWGNQTGGQPQVSSNATVTYSDIQGGFTGVGNINADPRFLSQTDLRLALNSPCIDAASNPAYFSAPGATFTDFANQPRGVEIPAIPDSGVGIAPIIDMGAYEAQPDTTPDCYANCDGSTTPPILNVNDFICFMSQYAAGCP